MKNKIKTLGILTILILFPLLSWYYLKTGYNYQMDSRAELKDYGKLPTFSFVEKDGTPFSQDSVGNVLSVFSFLGKNENTNQAILDNMVKLNIQFGDNAGLKLIISDLTVTADSKEKLNRIFSENKLDKDQHILITAENNKIQNLARKGFKVPSRWIEKENDAPDIEFLENSSAALSDYPFFIFVDKKNTIRNYYHVDKIEAVQRMVEHIALLLPREVRPDAVYVPEKEK